MPGFPLNGAVTLSVAFLFLPLVSSMAATIKGENKNEERVEVMATADLPAKSIDLAAVNLTELINGMLNTALRDTSKFFSLLSITSYSSYAFHKVSIAIYNISNLKNVDPSKFPMRHCYCLNNKTNDLTGFAALLVDIVGNTTNHLTEIFKSTSFVSVSQSNGTDCIYICVMSGHTDVFKGQIGDHVLHAAPKAIFQIPSSTWIFKDPSPIRSRNLSDLWEAIEKFPVINYTFSGNVPDLLDLNLILPGLMPLWEDADKSLGHPAKNTWTLKTTMTPVWAQKKEKEMLLTQHPMFLKTTNRKGAGVPLVALPLELPTKASKGYVVSSTKEATPGLPSAAVESYGSPPETMPTLIAAMPKEAWIFDTKGNETSPQQVWILQRTDGLEDSKVSPSHISLWLPTDTPKERKLSSTKMHPPTIPLTSYEILSGTQPLPTIRVPFSLASPSSEQDVSKTHPPSTGSVTFWTQAPSPKITKVPHQMQTGNDPLLAVVTPPLKPGFLLKVPSNAKGWEDSEE